MDNLDKFFEWLEKEKEEEEEALKIFTNNADMLVGTAEGRRNKAKANQCMRRLSKLKSSRQLICDFWLVI